MFPTARRKLLNVDFESITMSDPRVADMDKDGNLRELVTFVFDGFGKYTAGRLTAWSHKDGSPWAEASSSRHFRWGNIIPDESIKAYFQSIIDIRP